MNASVQDTMRNNSMITVIKYSLILELDSISQIKYTLKNCQPLLLQTMRKLVMTTKLVYKMFSFFKIILFKITFHKPLITVCYQLFFLICYNYHLIHNLIILEYQKKKLKFGPILPEIHEYYLI